MKITGFDHIVLCVADVSRTINFYCDLLGMTPVEERTGKWSLHFGNAKISLQNKDELPAIAKGTLPGSGNFCLIAETPVAELVERLDAKGVEIVAGPGERIGAIGQIYSVYFHDPDGNLVEISNRL